jgi:hypothetical protein
MFVVALTLLFVTVTLWTVWWWSCASARGLALLRPLFLFDFKGRVRGFGGSIGSLGESPWRGGRAVECTGLENRQAGNPLARVPEIWLNRAKC